MTDFNAETTADDVLRGIDLSGKRVLITGTSPGLGVETARVLAKRGGAGRLNEQVKPLLVSHFVGFSARL